MTEKRFPIQAPPDTPSRYTYPEFKSCSWALAERAYAVYASRYGTGQSLERMAERGGFGALEFIELLDVALSREGTDGGRSTVKSSGN
jgi:hypothetical protein